MISGRGDLFEILVNKGRNYINYDLKDKEGKTLFHLAAEIAHYKICEILLLKNVPIMALSNDGLMPVHYLVRINRSEINSEIANFRRIFLLIIQAGFDVNSCDQFGNSVLHSVNHYYYYYYFILYIYLSLLLPQLILLLLLLLLLLLFRLFRLFYYYLN